MLKSTTLRARKKASAASGHQVKKESVELPMVKLTEVRKGGGATIERECALTEVGRNVNERERKNMTKTNSRILLRCTGLVVLAVVALVLLPAAAQAQAQHGAQFAKSCQQNINRCATDSDCADANECTDDVCATTGDPGSNMIDCLFTVTNTDGFQDSLTILQATDTVTNGTGAPLSSDAILVVSTSGTVSGPGCDADSDIGGTAAVPDPTETCTLAFGASITFRSNFYTVQAADPTPLTDLAIASVLDECDSPTTEGCSNSPSPGGFGASSTVVPGCSNPVVAPSTPCGTDTDGNDCTAPGCTAAGVCDQAHNLDAPSTPCGTDTDGNDCTAPGCDAAGVCQQNHILDAPSTPCGTDADPTDCVTPGCTAAGECSQTHSNVADSTPCGTDTDGNDCTAPGCLAGSCDQTHILDAASTPCGTDADPTDCATPGCTAAGECSQTHNPVAASTPCGTDTDGLTCTIPGCTATGECSQTHVDECVGEEICRTPGFWGTHACGVSGTCEKATSQNITLALITAFNDANDPNLTICGTEINNASVGNVNSALEAICVSPKGDSVLQLARQLMSAALNCIITNGGNGDSCVSLTGAVCGGVSIEDVFNACNTACEAGSVTATVDTTEINCIEVIDCFNNGGETFDPVLGCLGNSGCHEAELDNGCVDFTPPGPAGSPKACNDARKNDVEITD
jgi:hypothetical protein